MRTKLAFIIAAALALLCLPASAQMATLGSVVVYQNVASNLAAPLALDVRGQKEVALQWTVTHSGTATTAEGIQIRDSINGTTASGRMLNMVLTPASATAVHTITNITVSGFPYLMITYVTNKDGDTYSTNVFKYWIKKNAP